MVVWCCKYCILSRQVEERKKEKQVEEKLAEKPTDDRQNHILFNDDRFRDNAGEISFKI